MQNVNVVSRPNLHALSNGALVFALSLILLTRKWIKTIHENWACIQHAFSAFKTQLTGKPSVPYERT